MYRKDKERYAIGIFVSNMVGSLLYLLFTNWIFLAAGLASGMFFLMKVLLPRRR